MSCTFVKNCSSDINWYQIIESLAGSTGKEIVVDPAVLTGNEYTALFNLWAAASYNIGSIKWINYYPEDYGADVGAYFETILGVTHIRSWISRIDPGYSAPWHYDIDYNEREYLKLGHLRRFVCYIGDPAPGHISIVGNQCFYNQENGDIYEWDNYREWHAGANVGLAPKYQYNFLSYC